MLAPLHRVPALDGAPQIPTSSATETTPWAAGQTPDRTGGTRGYTLAWLALPAIFGVDLLTGGHLALAGIYLFPLAAIALLAPQRIACMAALLTAILFQVATLGPPAAAELPRLLDTLIGIGAGAATVLLARIARERHLAILRLAGTDALTGLFNRRAFEAAAAAELEAQARLGSVLSVALVDLDEFKQLNDTHGHAAGDRALVVLARTLRGALRESDCVARIGGDEFAVLLPHTRADDCRELCATLCETIAERMRAAGLEVTATIGSITFDRPPASLAEALRLADQALYKAKAAEKGSAASLVSRRGDPRTVRDVPAKRRLAKAKTGTRDVVPERRRRTAAR